MKYPEYLITLEGPEGGGEKMIGQPKTLSRI